MAKAVLSGRGYHSIAELQGAIKKVEIVHSGGIKVLEREPPKKSLTI